MDANKLIIKRSRFTDKCVLGTLRTNSGLILFTLEPPEKNNSKNSSCIPFGDYSCRIKKSKKLGFVVEVIDVPNRTDILIHVGNYPEDTHGCILVGMSIAKNDTLIDSKRAMALLTDELFSYKNITLSVR